MINRCKPGASIFADLRREYFPSCFMGNQLSAITNPQHWQTLKERKVNVRRSGIPHRTRATRKNDSFYIGGDDGNFVEGVDFTIHVKLANATCDQLCVLGTEVEDENLLCHAQK